jgi:hypothetical protein
MYSVGVVVIRVLIVLRVSIEELLKRVGMQRHAGCSRWRLHDCTRVRYSSNRVRRTADSQRKYALKCCLPNMASRIIQVYRASQRHGVGKSGRPKEDMCRGRPLIGKRGEPPPPGRQIGGAGTIDMRDVKCRG